MNYYVIGGLVLLLFDLYCLFNYSALLQRQFDAFGLGDDESDRKKKKQLEFRQRIGFIMTLGGAIWLLSQGIVNN